MEEGGWTTAFTLTFRRDQKRRAPERCLPPLETWAHRVRAELHAEARFLAVIEASLDGTMHAHGVNDSPLEFHTKMRELWVHGLQKLIEPLGADGQAPRLWFRYCLKNVVSPTAKQQAAPVYTF